MFSEDAQGFLFSLLLTGSPHAQVQPGGHCQPIPKTGDYLEYLSPREDSRLAWLKLGPRSDFG